ncbi:MAG: Hsp20/alpha crystallin family protein [Candidatus Omnitrophota bacterium]
MSLIKWNSKNDPFQEFLSLDNDWSGFSFLPVSNRRLAGLRDKWYPSFDVSEEQGSVVIKADLPGMKKEEVDISLENNILKISGERKFEVENKEKNYYHLERSYGAFERSFDLGALAVDPTKVKAGYKEGVLEIVLPKREADSPAKKIEIKEG